MGDDGLDVQQGQRDFLRSAVEHLIRDNKDRLIDAYAEAERSGRVQRQHNGRGMSAQEYGARLIQDALGKGWLIRK